MTRQRNAVAALELGVPVAARVSEEVLFE